MRTTQRMASLLEKAAACFEGGQNPFHHERLSEDRVTFMECEQLSELIGAVLRGFVRSTDKAQTEILLLSAAGDNIPAERLRAFIEHCDTLKQLVPSVDSGRRWVNASSRHSL